MFTPHIERCLLKALAKNDDSTIARRIGMNLDVETVTAPEFLEFDGLLSSEMRQTMIVESSWSMSLPITWPSLSPGKC